MIKKILLPQVELNMESVDVVKWLVAVGDKLTLDQPIMEVETQKATVEVTASQEGFARKLCVEAGDSIGENALLCLVTDSPDEPLEDDALPVAAPPSAASAESQAPTRAAHATSGNGHERSVGGIPRAAPAARKLARENGIDLETITGSGPRGRIKVEDIERAVARQGSTAGSCAGATASPIAPAGVWTPLPLARQTLNRQMQLAVATIPQINIMRQLDLTPLSAKATGITLTHRLVYCLGRALGRHPALRTLLSENKVKVTPESVAVAMDTHTGLLAPVVRNIAALTLTQVAETVTGLKLRADSGKLRAEDLEEGPFALTNLGMLGVDLFTPLVFDGQTAVLAVGRAIDGPAGRRAAWFTLAADHRVVDGAEAARFLQTLQEVIDAQ